MLFGRADKTSTLKRNKRSMFFNHAWRLAFITLTMMKWFVPIT